MKRTGIDRRRFLRASGLGLSALLSQPLTSLGHEESCGCSDPNLGNLPNDPMYQIWMCNGFADMNRDGNCRSPHELIGINTRFRHSENLVMAVRTDGPDQVGKEAQLEIWNSNGMVYRNQFRPFYITSNNLVAIETINPRLFPGEYSAFFKLNGVTKAKSEFSIIPCDSPLPRSFKPDLETPGVRLFTCNSVRDHEGKGFISSMDYSGVKTSFKPRESMVGVCSIEDPSSYDGRELVLKVFNARGESIEMNRAFVNNPIVLYSRNVMPEVFGNWGEGHYAIAGLVNGKYVGIKHVDVRQGCGKC